MKKYFFTMMTTAMLFASCSSDDTVAPDNGTENQEDLVEIKLGTSSRIGTTVTESRAVDKWNNTTIGVFALDKDATTAWVNDATGSDNQPVKMDNVAGTVSPSGESDQNTENIVFEQKHYYPRRSTRNYEFYGYHPNTTGETEATIEVNGTASTGKLFVTGPFDGTQDIMAGKSQDVTNGFNAKYFRDNQESAETPNITFKHLTSRIQIKILKGADFDDTKCGITKLEMSLPESYSYDLIATAAINSFDDTTPAPTIEWTYPAAADALTTIHEPQTADIANTEASTASETDKSNLSPICDFMVPAGYGNYNIDETDTDPEGYLLYITFNEQDSNGSNIISDVPLSLPNYNPFIAGKKYVVYLTINGPKEITITATLEPWEDGEIINADI